MFATGRPPREVFAIKLSDVRFAKYGLSVMIGDEDVRIYSGDTALCPVKAIRAWIGEGKLAGGYLFPILQGKNAGKQLNVMAQIAALKSIARKARVNPAGMCCTSLLEGRKLDYNDTRALSL